VGKKMQVNIKLITYSTWFLKIITIIAFSPVIYFCGILFPIIFHSLIVGDIEMDIPVFIIMISSYLVAWFYSLGLYQIFLILKMIKPENIDYLPLLEKLKKLLTCTTLVTIILFLDLIPLYFFANREDAPGILLLGILLVGLGIVVSVILLIIKELADKPKKIMPNN
jgi:hypothetical protein